MGTDDPIAKPRSAPDLPGPRPRTCTDGESRRVYGLDDAPVTGVVGPVVLLLELVCRDDEPMAPASFDDHAALVALHDFAGDCALEKPVL